jgi:hypothetical protein
MHICISHHVVSYSFAYHLINDLDYVGYNLIVFPNSFKIM